MTTKITEQNISELANAGVNWQSVFTGDGSTGLTAVAGRGYFINTTSGTVTVTLPASPSAGDVVVLKDYARTWNTNNVTTNSVLSDGSTNSLTFSTNGQTVTLVYMDGTKGWSLINEDTTTELQIPAAFISATGGTVTTSGDYKIHTFTGDGCFVVSTLGNAPLSPIGGPDVVDYLVVAGGGGTGGGEGVGGSGAGGYRESSGAASGCYTVSPLGSGVCGITVTATTYPITVGGGGSGAPATGETGINGSNSVFSTITSAGGGGSGAGGGAGPTGNGANGGSGGGGGGRECHPGGTGNTPPVSPPQGNSGGNSAGVGPPSSDSGGGGGGATAAGTNGTSLSTGGNGGAGATSSINGTPTGRAGGGAGGSEVGAMGSASDGGSSINGGSGTANTGGGSAGRTGPNALGGVNGGKGIVIIRYKFQ